jgi:hypothetical protein
MIKIYSMNYIINSTVITRPGPSPIPSYSIEIAIPEEHAA